MLYIIFCGSVLYTASEVMSLTPSPLQFSTTEVVGWLYLTIIVTFRNLVSELQTHRCAEVKTLAGFELLIKVFFMTFTTISFTFDMNTLVQVRLSENVHIYPLF